MQVGEPWCLQTLQSQQKYHNVFRRLNNLFAISTNDHNWQNAGSESKNPLTDTERKMCLVDGFFSTTGAVDCRYSDVIMGGAMASQITSLTTVYSTVYSGADQRKYRSSASLALVLGIHRWPVNSPHKWPVTRKMFPFDDVTMSFWKPSTYPVAIKAVAWANFAYQCNNTIAMAILPFGRTDLNHWRWVTHTCVNKLDQYWLI